MTWKKLDPVEELIACNVCAPKGQTIALDEVCGVGFGYVALTKDGDVIWQEDSETVTVADHETTAAADPDHDWRIDFYGPMRRLVYQRHGVGEWVLIMAEQGFA